MNHVAECAAGAGFVAQTSRFIYASDPTTGEIRREPFGPDPDVPMIETLEKQLIEGADVAIVVYSVSAGHYNEAHWCASHLKRTLGIAFVRGIRVTGIDEEPKENCVKLFVSPDEAYSACSAIAPWTAWYCIETKPCPFKKQGISLNQVEYFITNSEFMSIVAVERLQAVRPIVRSFLAGTFRRPTAPGLDTHPDQEP